jgi:hypothetical protein
VTAALRTLNRGEPMVSSFTLRHWFLRSVMQLQSARTCVSVVRPPTVCADMGNVHLSFPHGLNALTPTAINAVYYGQQYSNTLVASVLHCIPGLFPMWISLSGMNAVTITPATVRAALSPPAFGRVSQLFVGGIQDLLASGNGADHVTMAGHKGLFRLCLEHGANLNVSYTFGHNNAWVPPVAVQWALSCLPMRYQGYARLAWVHFMQCGPTRATVTNVAEHAITVFPVKNWTEDHVSRSENAIGNPNLEKRES